MIKAYKYRIYPNEEQKELFAKTFGCVRYVYNWGLNLKTSEYEENNRNVGITELMNRLSSELKRECEWLNEVNAQSLQSALRNLNDAYQRFFEKKACYPRFKKKKGTQTFSNPQTSSIDFKRGLLHIRKAKNIKIKIHRKFKADRIHNVVISMDSDGKYYASILVDTFEQPLPKSPVSESTTIGLDSGLNTLITCSDGRKVPAPTCFQDNERKRRLLNRKLSRKKRGSNSYEKARKRLGKLHAKGRHFHFDYLHKLTYQLTHENQVRTICVEDLNAQEFIDNKRLFHVAQDASVGRFLKFLSYKCDWYGINYIKIGKYQPSSKTCSTCGFIKKNLKLKTRRWVCPKCGTHHDRDYNASLNIKSFGLKTLRTERTEVKLTECPLVDDRVTHV